MKEQGISWNRALLRGHTYNPLGNRYAAGGLGLGLGILVIGILMCATMMGGHLAHVIRIYLSDPLHLAFLSVPLLLMVALGAAGTVKKDREDRLKELSERAITCKVEAERIEREVRDTIASHLSRVKEVVSQKKVSDDHEADLSRQRIASARGIVEQAAMVVKQARTGMEIVQEAMRNIGHVVPGFDPIWADRLIDSIDQIHMESSRLLGMPGSGGNGKRRAEPRPDAP